MIMKTTILPLTLLLSIILTGCGRPEPPPPEPAESETVDAPVAGPIPEPIPADPEAPADEPAEPPAESPALVEAPPPALDFEAALREVIEMERQTDFVRAFQRCRELQEIFQEPDQAAELAATLRRLQAARREGPQLAGVVRNLGAADSRTRQVARGVIEEAGDLGLLYLRHALRTAEPPVAQEAARILVAQQDLEALPVFLELIREEPDSARGQAVRALALMPAQVGPDIAAACLEALQTDVDHAARHLIDVSEALFEHVCAYDPQAFNALVGHPFGLDVVREYVGSAFLSTNAAIVQWACERIPDFLPMFNGLRGEYFSTATFENQVLDRVDARVHVDNRAFPMPDNQQDQISVRWTGGLLVREEGEYTFNLPNCNPDARLWVGRDRILHSPHQQTAKRSLTPGWHPIRIDYTKGDGNGHVYFNWSGSNAVLQTKPWPDLVARMASAASDLSSTNHAIANPARRTLADGAGLGRNFLLDRMRNDPTIGGQRARDLLGQQVSEIPGYILRQLVADALAADAKPLNRSMAVVCAALWRRCGNDPEAFNELAGDPEAYPQLEAQVTAALTSADNDTVARAARDGYPFAPLMPGLVGRYYDDPRADDLVLERQDRQINIGNRLFPLATNRQDNISAEWTGMLRIEQAGEYALWGLADTRFEIVVNERHRLRGWGFGHHGHNRLSVTLTSGVHAIRFHYVQNQTGHNAQVRLDWEGPGISGRQVIPSSAFRCAPWDARLDELREAIETLAADDMERIRAARDVLSASGPVGLVYLRNAVRHAAAPTAAAAARWLGEARDPLAPPVLLARLEVETDPAAVTALTDALMRQADQIAPETVPMLYRRAMADDAAPMNPHVSILGATLLSLHGEADAFNARVDDAAGYDTLARHVSNALASADTETVARACRDGAPFAPVLHGLLGRYYHGQDYLDRVIEQVDRTINVPNRQFPFPEERQDDITVRWEGFLRIATPGDYTLIVNAHNQANVWVNHRHVATSTDWGEQKKDEITLVEGWHRLRVDFRQLSGSSQVQLSWIRPDGQRAVIPAAALAARPTRTMLDRVKQRVANLPLVGGETNVIAAAHDGLNPYGDVSRFYLHRALTRAPAQAAPAVVPALVALRDPELTPRIADTMETEPAVAVAIEVVLEILAAEADARYAAWFYSVMLADEELRFPVSSRFLSRLLETGCGNNAGTFNNLVGDPKGHEALKAYLDRMAEPEAPDEP